METFTSDADYVMSKIGMRKNDLFYKENKSTGNSTTDLALKLFASRSQKNNSMNCIKLTLKCLNMTLSLFCKTTNFE